MATRIRLEMDPADRILLKRKLNKNGEGQRFFTHQVRTLSDPYVPFLNGPLKNTAQELVDRIEYIQPYARRQYYENAGSGIEGTAHHGLRGKQWDKRMWADRGPQIVKAVANFVGGRPG